MTSKYKYQGNPRKPKLGTEKCKNCGHEENRHGKDYCDICSCSKFQPEDEIVTTDYETKPEIDAFVKGFMKGKQKKGSSEDVPDCEKYDKDILGKHTLTKQKKGSSEDVSKVIINPMKDMVRNGKDWKKKGCNCYGICLDKSCSNQSPQKDVIASSFYCHKPSEALEFPKGKESREIQKDIIESLGGPQTLSDKITFVTKDEDWILLPSDVKQSIKKLKEFAHPNVCKECKAWLVKINQIFGEKLV